MQRTLLAAGAGVLAVAAASLLLLSGGSPRREASVDRVDSPPAALEIVRAQPAAEPAAIAAAPGPAPAAARIALARPAGENASRIAVDLLALEEQALRRIDVVPLLESAGVDVHALRKRPDVDDILRKVAADELLTRGVMRDLFAATVYPYGYSRELALRDTRAAAEGMIAALGPAERAETIARELETPASDPPEPVFYGQESGRIYESKLDAEAGR